MTIMELCETYVANTYKRFPATFARGCGARLWDEDGKEYLDLGSGIAVNAFGVADDKWAEAVIHQVRTLQHTCNLYYAEPCAKLAEQLCLRTGMRKVFFSNSGAEANECMLKAARKFGEATGRDTIITLKDSFHGRTIATLAATGQDVFHRHFGPFPAGFAFAGPDDLNSIKALADAGNCCAVMLEIVQGEGGVRALKPEFLQGVEALCREKDMLLLVDEVQTGNGRSGMLYAYMTAGLSPDIVSTAKGLGGGLPIGATLFNDRTKDVLQAGDHGSTFGGNPVSCAGALSVLNRIDEKLLEEVREKSAYIVGELTGAKGVLSVSGLGLMLGVEVERPAVEIANDCLKRGVLVLTAKKKLRLLPALNIGWDELKAAVSVLKEVIAG
ncbi:MAG: aminotransferase class III-fold pyridoxal phosphate-dependent enzyme [Clostridiales bacterium]|nr:aminotransferase class III-fold pyridoxal phosphate-dependent enzyme [Clostridiales bacterium]OPZ66864.1 MAG: Acetylornithine aminotransferase [Firmicutes bacterium ADurb.Bin467]